MAAEESRERVDRLFSAAYEELRRLAAVVRRGDRAASLTPTTLVNEAWLRLAGSPPAETHSRLHFKRIAARAMRQVLVEAARRRHTDKRGGDSIRVEFDESIDGAVVAADELLRLDDALESLARVAPRQAQIVELRYFGGLTVDETAAALELSEATVRRDGRSARAWLASELAGE